MIEDIPHAGVSSTQAGTLRWTHLAGGAGGPLLALLLYLALPDEFVSSDGAAMPFTPAGRATLGMLAWMALWWMTETVPVEVTALLPVMLFPLLGIASLSQASAPYGSDLIFLFLGGFILAAATHRWKLDLRIALCLMRLMGTGARRLLAGMMAATAFISMWVSNTATAAMMVPIARAVVDLDDTPRDATTQAARARFARALVLAIAYAASIGGMGTLIGSPPNGILARYVEQTFGMEISFARWMLVAMPLVLLLLPLTWWLLSALLLRGDAGHAAAVGQVIDARLQALGPLSRAERLTLLVFGATALCWMSRPFLIRIEFAGHLPLAGLTDAGIALAAAVVLFLLPAQRGHGTRLMDWKSAERIPWGVLFLFGGGLSLAAAMEANGVAQFISAQVRDLGGWPALAVLLAVITLTMFLSEVMSNTAQVAAMLPVLSAMAPVFGLQPVNVQWQSLWPPVVPSCCRRARAPMPSSSALGISLFRKCAERDSG